MASEQVLDVAVRRHIFNSERPFPMTALADDVARLRQVLCQRSAASPKRPARRASLYP
jgi:hypothetical protein